METTSVQHLSLWTSIQHHSFSTKYTYCIFSSFCYADTFYPQLFSKCGCMLFLRQRWHYLSCYEFHRCGLCGGCILWKKMVPVSFISSSYIQHIDDTAYGEVIWSNVSGRSSKILRLSQMKRHFCMEIHFVVEQNCKVMQVLDRLKCTTSPLLNLFQKYWNLSQGICAAFTVIPMVYYPLNPSWKELFCSRIYLFIFLAKRKVNSCQHYYVKSSLIAIHISEISSNLLEWK